VKTFYIAVGTLVVALVGCTPDPKSGIGFTLPEGDIERGQQTFSKLNCQACHTVAGVTFDGAEPSPDHKIVALGGAKSKVQTYGDLVTSIINPSHRFAGGYAEEDVATAGESKMRLYNDEMTVQQLIDLVTFLESHYSVIRYDRTPYGPYYY
jgi:mono/diheme cytochrome c family protein